MDRKASAEIVAVVAGGLLISSHSLSLSLLPPFFFFLGFSPLLVIHLPFFINIFLSFSPLYRTLYTFTLRPRTLLLRPCVFIHSCYQLSSGIATHASHVVLMMKSREVEKLVYQLTSKSYLFYFIKINI